MNDQTRQRLRKDAEKAHRDYVCLSPRNFMFFCRGLTIAAAHGPKLFQSCMYDFQREAFEALAPALHAVRDGLMPPVRRFWFERTKKAAKDSDIAIALLWVTAFSERPVFCQVCASNQKQSGIIRRRALDLIHYNPWLANHVEVQRNGLLSKRFPDIVRTRIEATDSRGGAHGETPDILVLNELVHVAEWQAMEDHMNNASGVPRGVVIVSTNAGYKGSKAEVWRKNAIDNPERWSSHVWDKPSPWLDVQDVDEAKKRNTESEYKRLWSGVWSGGSGDTVDETLIDRCFRQDLAPHNSPKPGWEYIAGLDLGVKNDHAGLAVLGVNQATKRIQVARLYDWAPDMPVTGSSRLEVNSEEIEATCDWVHHTFRLRWFGFDPAVGGTFMAQALRRRGVPMQEMAFNPANCTAMAVSFMQVIEQGVLESFENGGLKRDFKKFKITAKLPTGYKLDAVSDEHGHADVGTAVVIALPKAIEIMGGLDGGLVDEDFDGWDDTSPLSDEEVKKLPDDLKSIVDYENESQGEVVGKGRGRKRAVRRKFDW